MNLNFVVSCVTILVVTSGCSGPFSVGRYDSAIETGVNSYHIKASAFISEAEKNDGLSDGNFSSKKSTEFYSEQGAVLTNLIIRAQAADDGKPCPITMTNEVLTFAPPHVSQTLQPKNENNRDGCTVVVLKHLKLTHTELENIHRESKYLRPPTSDIIASAIDDAVRIALKNEQAKK